MLFDTSELKHCEHLITDTHTYTGISNLFATIADLLPAVLNTWRRCNSEKVSVCVCMCLSVCVSL